MRKVNCFQKPRLVTGSVHFTNYRFALVTESGGMMSIQDKFTSENPYVLTPKFQTANNNQTGFNVAIDETIGVKATSIVFQPQGLTGTLSNPAPTSVLTAGQQTVGAALGGLAGGGHACFTGETLVGKRRIDSIQVGDKVSAFNPETREVGKAKVTHTFIHEVFEILRVELANGKVLNVTPEHRFYDGEDFAQIGNFTTENWVFDENFRVVPIRNIYRLRSDKAILVYNFATEWGTYIAEDTLVSNLKPENTE